MRISEHEIGTHVFKRGEDFDARADNIVRNYARQLRKRLQEYYVSDGANDPIQIEIPRGGYAPVFRDASLSSPQSPTWTQESERVAVLGEIDVQTSPIRTNPRRITWGALFLVLLYGYSAGIYRFARWHPDTQKSKQADNSFWSQMFSPDRDTYIVLPDIGFVIMQQANHRTLSLAEYLRWHSGGDSKNLPMDYLRGEDYTNMLSIFITDALRELKEAIPSRFVVRGAHDMRFEDFRDNNAILIGSNFSNPWTELFFKDTNFRFHNNLQTGRYWIENVRRIPGEQLIYESKYGDHAHVTYASIVFLANLSGTGHVLLIQGIDSAGTQAAADFIIRNNGKKTVPDQIGALSKGKIRGFEVLLEVVSLDAGSHTTDLKVVASRQYP